MAEVHYFLKFEGGVAAEGESKDKQHAGEIELLGFSFRQMNKASGDAGGGQSTGKVKMEDLVVRMATSKVSPVLFSSVATGVHWDKATLTCLKATGKGGQDWYLKLTLTEVFPTLYTIVGSDPEVELLPIQGFKSSALIPYEEVHLSYDTFQIEYRPQKKDGTMDAAVTAQHDRKQNI